MNNKGLSLPSVLFYTVALAASVITIISVGYGYGAFAKKYAAAQTKQPAAELPACQAHHAQAMQPRNVKFNFKSPRAKEVVLIAEFNLWGRHKLELENTGSGTFSKTVILPQGEYKYYYNVDGKDMKDPSALQSAFFEGKEVSVRVVL
jgi:1,4-alpha-glucan branching enzyme